jgi:hypothetical protein
MPAIRVDQLTDPADLAALAAAVGIGGLNLRASKVPRLANALAQCEMGITPARTLLAFLGDSTTVPYRSSSDKKVLGWLSRLIAKLQQHSPFDENSFFGQQAAGAITNTTNFDPRIVPGAGVAIGAEPSMGGGGFDLAAATGPLTFTPTVPFDQFDLVLVAGGAGGTVGVSIDGGAVQNIVGPTSNLQKTTIDVSLGSPALHSIAITKVSGSPCVQAISCRDTTKPRVMIGNMARAGASSVSWTYVNSIGPKRSPMNAVYEMAPLAVVLNIGVNDWSTAATPLATYIANMQTLIDKFKADSDVILMVPFPSDATAYPTQATFVAALRQLAVTNNLPLIDLGYAMTSWEVSNPLGRYADGRHLAALGHAFVVPFLNQCFWMLRSGF